VVYNALTVAVRAAGLEQLSFFIATSPSSIRSGVKDFLGRPSPGVGTGGLPAPGPPRQLLPLGTHRRESRLPLARSQGVRALAPRTRRTASATSAPPRPRATVQTQLRNSRQPSSPMPARSARSSKWRSSDRVSRLDSAWSTPSSAVDAKGSDITTGYMSSRRPPADDIKTAQSHERK
jgi:hypothetical protein